MIWCARRNASATALANISTGTNISSSMGNKLKLPEDTPYVMVKKSGTCVLKGRMFSILLGKEKRTGREQRKEDWNHHSIAD